jgi:hypothetical protein
MHRGLLRVVFFVKSLHPPGLLGQSEPRRRFCRAILPLVNCNVQHIDVSRAHCPVPTPLVQSGVDAVPNDPHVPNDFVPSDTGRVRIVAAICPVSPAVARLSL